jgi:ADP-heptose:LPS heptosyltransferase
MADRRTTDRTVLVLHMNALGEAVFALPLLHALKHDDPPWRTVCVARPDVAALLQASGLADEVLRRQVPPGAGGSWQLLRALRRARPQVSLGLATSAGNTLMAWLSGARRRIGYDYAHLPRLLHLRVPFEGGGIENYLSLLPYVPAPRTVSSYVGLLQVPAQAQEEADRLLDAAGISAQAGFVALSPISTGKQGVKAYPPEQWAEVCRLLREAGRPLVLVGSEADTEAHRVMLASGDGPAASLAGRTPTLILAGMLARAECVVGIDTGPIHVAAAVGTPCVVLFGSSDPARTAPSGEGHTILYRALDCQPCLGLPCRRAGACLRQITPEEIVAAVEDTLSRGAGFPSPAS